MKPFASSGQAFRFIRFLNIQAFVISTTTIELSNCCDLANVLEKPNVCRTLRLHCVRNVCHKSGFIQSVPWRSCIPVPLPAQSEAKGQNILWLSRRRWLWGHPSRLGTRLVARSVARERLPGYPVPHIHFMQRIEIVR